MTYSGMAFCKASWRIVAHDSSGSVQGNSCYRGNIARTGNTGLRTLGTGEGKEHYPYVRTLGGISLFDFNQFEPDSY